MSLVYKEERAQRDVRMIITFRIRASFTRHLISIFHEPNYLINTFMP